jgi:site-specific recombinase XerC
MVAAKRVGENPLGSLSLLNAKVEVRRTRREQTAAQLRALLDATRASGRAFRGLTGDDRFHLYLTAAGTGFRASASASLTPADFDLSADTPIVTLPARFNKSRKTKEQPLPPEVADQLREYLTGKPAGEPVWGGTWASDHRGAEMLRADLEAAGIPYVVEGPDGPEYADFHSLRHSYLTLLGQSGVELRTLMEMAGHSKSELTVRYSHRRLYDLAGAAGKLPSILPPGTGPADQRQQLPATGTDGRTAVGSGFGCRMVAAPAVSGGLSLSLVGGGEGGVGGDLETAKPPVSQGFRGRLSQPDSGSLSEDDGTRTRNHRIDRQAANNPFGRQKRLAIGTLHRPPARFKASHS